MTEDHFAPSTLALARRLWRDHLGRQWRRLALALLAMGVYAASSSLIPAGIEQINAALLGADATTILDPRAVILWGPLLIVGLGALNAGAQYAQARLAQGAALRAVADVQRAMFESLTAQDYAQLRDDRSGQIVSSFTNDAAALRETLARALNGLRDAMTFAGLCAVMAYYDAILFAIVATVYALIGWPLGVIGKRLRRAAREVQKEAGDLTQMVAESLDAARLVRVFQLEAHERARAETAIAARLQALLRQLRLRALNEPFIFVVGSAAAAVVVGAAVWRIEEDALTAARFFSFIVALLLLSQPARGLSSLLAAMQEGFAAFERMTQIIDRAPLVVDAPGAQALSVKGGAISFRDVSFSYGDGPPALDGFSLEVPAGAVVALVGESGAGKSTVFSLLPRLYERRGGVITIDGQDIATATRASLRAAISIVSQDAFLFNDTIGANIALGRLGADEAAIQRAAQAAALDEFIRTLPDGLNARVGEGGARLSGGQRQRVALARAFLKDAPILLLDEATSALDADSEARVLEALARLMKGRTTLVIAHRLATVLRADLIAVMEKGRVVETGTHASLIAKDGLYARLARLQFDDGRA